MPALLSAWLGAACLLIALGMVVYRPLFTDTLLVVVLYSAAGSMALAGIGLWALRKANRGEAGVRLQRLQCKVGIVTALIGAGIIYALVIGAERLPAEASPVTSLLLHSAAFQTS